MRGRFIAYYRVSTARQGRSGLGLDAQRASVLAYLNGGRWELVEEFTEVESGRKNDRPQLTAALSACRAQKATLVIAKLDRLARNVAFVSALMEAGVEFVACDFPQANRLTLHILSAVAEHEARMISERTKAALAAAKARGKKLGGGRGRNITASEQQMGVAATKARADAYARDLAPVIQAAITNGHTNPTSIARALNNQGVPAPRGGSWSTIQVQRLVQRMDCGIGTVSSHRVRPFPLIS